MGDRELNSHPGVDPSRPTAEHKQEINLFMSKLCAELGLGEQWDEMTRYVNLDDGQALGRRSSRIKEFGPRFEGEIASFIKKNGSAALNNMIQKIQAENGQAAIKGILTEQQKKVSKDEIVQGKISLQEYTRPDLKDKVQKLRDLQSGKGRKTKDQMASEDAALLDRVVSLIDNGQYPQVSAEGISLLDKTIQQLQGASDAEAGIKTKKNAPKAEGKSAGGVKKKRAA